MRIFFCFFVLYFSAVSGVEVCMQDEVVEKIHRVESHLLPAVVVDDMPVVKDSLQARMKAVQVPAVSIAVINDGKIEWAKAYGMLCAERNVPANISTIFQAGSVSKPVAAFGALTLVEKNILQLDDDVNHRLTQWKVPENAYTKERAVTLRQVLSHSSGCNVIGFDGYKQGETLPSLVEILRGAASANNTAIQVEYTPGTKMSYSGGGYCVMQQLVEEVTSMPFSEFMHKNIFAPLDMSRSSMFCPFVEQENMAYAHPSDGKVMSGGYKNYPESAAAGLWTTPSDLATWLIHISQVLQEGHKKPIVNRDMLQLMITPQIAPYGLGPVVNGCDISIEVSHKGRTDGFVCGYVFYPFLGKGAVVMLNSDNGACLVDEILRSVSYVYEWPSYHMKKKKAIAVTKEEVSRYLGRYGTTKEKNDIYDVVVSEQDGELFIKLGAASIPYKMYCSDTDHFFILESGFEVIFHQDELVIVIQEGFDRKFHKFPA